MTELAVEMTPQQSTAYVLIVLFVWLGFAVLLGVAIGKSIRNADRSEQPAGTDDVPAAVELGTRLDRYL